MTIVFRADTIFLLVSFHSPSVCYLLFVPAFYLCLFVEFTQPFICLEILALCLSLLLSPWFLSRSVPCFRRRGALRHARSISCDAPSVFQWKPSFQNSTASCPLRAVSSPRTCLCSDQTHTHTHIHTLGIL